MTRWPAICSGDSLEISPDWMARSASWTLVGVAAGPWTASAAAAAGLGDGCWLADGSGDAEWLAGGRGDAGLSGERDEPQPAATPSATMASPAITARPASLRRRRRPEFAATELLLCNSYLQTR